MHTHSRP